MTRQEIIDRTVTLRRELKDLRGKLEQVDYDERYAEASKFINRSFIEVDSRSNGRICCVYVFGIEPVNCTTKAIQVSYYPENDMHFSIEYDYHFNPESIESSRKFTEISREEFQLHYDQVQLIIAKVLSK
jgi:hypothetical protein